MRSNCHHIHIRGSIDPSLIVLPVMFGEAHRTMNTLHHGYHEVADPRSIRKKNFILFLLIPFLSPK